MPKKYKKTDITSQFGLINRGNTCYINTAIQTLLSIPNLPEIIAKREAQLKVASSTLEEDTDQTKSLCRLLDYLLKKQYGESVDESVIDAAWNDFLLLFRSRVVDNTSFGSRQEDSSFALNLFFELLRMEAPLQQKTVKHYGETSFRGVSIPAEEQSDSLPCFVLQWPSHIAITTLFEEQSCEIEGAKHPYVSEEEKSDVVSCSEKTQVHMQAGADAFVLLPNHIPLEGNEAGIFAPTECQYNIPVEIELTIQGIKDTFVLASFGQKRGDAGSGHYVAYRREGDQWYEVDDRRVTTQGMQAHSTSIPPKAIQSALKSEHWHCARELVYVRKSTYMAQYNKAELKETSDLASLQIQSTKQEQKTRQKKKVAAQITGITNSSKSELSARELIQEDVSCATKSLAEDDASHRAAHKEKVGIEDRVDPLHLKFITEKQKRIDSIIKQLEEKIGKIDQHKVPEARIAAEVLLSGLKVAAFDFFRDLKQDTSNYVVLKETFLDDCSKYIESARPTLEKDLGWSVYLANFFQAIVNVVISIYTLGRVNNFFKPMKAESVSAVDKAKTDLENELPLWDLK